MNKKVRAIPVWWRIHTNGAAVQHALYGVNQFHNAYTIYDLDDEEEIITIGGTHE